MVRLRGYPTASRHAKVSALASCICKHGFALLTSNMDDLFDVRHRCVLPSYFLSIILLLLQRQRCSARFKHSHDKFRGTVKCSPNFPTFVCVTLQWCYLGVFDCKPLQVLWGKYPGQYSRHNTIMLDDLRRNYVLNRQNGLVIRPYRKVTRVIVWLHSC